ncbi:hypothetical protein [Burkholderia pyrrocinia]|uniref:Integrase n=1 Tax=Burkholderia pyrrocinia TaxID=60550 RepID=A0ABZ3BEP3_BURPY
MTLQSVSSGLRRRHSMPQRKTIGTDVYSAGRKAWRSTLHQRELERKIAECRR